MGSRRKARELALQVLYTMDLTGNWHEETEAIHSDADRRAANMDFSTEIVEGVRREREGIDQAIGAAAEHWNVSRMGTIERTLLRIASFELLFREEIPARVSINEALELAKTYGSNETHRFLNGILDRIARQKLDGAQVRG